MKKNISILLDEDGDLLLDGDGKPVVGDTSQQNIEQFLNDDQGHLKLDPLSGIGADGFIDDENVHGLIRNTRIQLKRDGYKTVRISSAENGIQIHASYE